jgi:hypothetical protein
MDHPWYGLVPYSGSISNPIDLSHGGRFNPAAHYGETIFNYDGSGPIGPHEVTYRPPWTYYFVNWSASPGIGYAVQCAYPPGSEPMALEWSCAGPPPACGPSTTAPDLYAGETFGLFGNGDVMTMGGHGRGWWRTGPDGGLALWFVAPRQLCMQSPTDDWSPQLCADSIPFETNFGVCEYTYTQPVNRVGDVVNTFAAGYLFRGRSAHRHLEIEISASTGLPPDAPNGPPNLLAEFGFRLGYEDGSGPVVICYQRHDHAPGLGLCDPIFGPGFDDCGYFEIGTPGGGLYSDYYSGARQNWTLKAVLNFDIDHELTDVDFFVNGSHVVNLPASGLNLHENCLYELQLSAYQQIQSCGLTNAGEANEEINSVSGDPEWGSFDPAHAFGGDTFGLSNFRIHSYA